MELGRLQGIVLLELEIKDGIKDDEHKTSVSELICRPVAAAETTEERKD